MISWNFELNSAVGPWEVLYDNKLRLGEQMGSRQGIVGQISMRVPRAEKRCHRYLRLTRRQALARATSKPRVSI